jgi:hypothetical protein
VDLLLTDWPGRAVQVVVATDREELLEPLELLTQVAVVVVVDFLAQTQVTQAAQAAPVSSSLNTPFLALQT